MSFRWRAGKGEGDRRTTEDARQIGRGGGGFGTQYAVSRKPRVHVRTGGGVSDRLNAWCFCPYGKVMHTDIIDRAQPTNHPHTAETGAGIISVRHPELGTECSAGLLYLNTRRLCIVFLSSAAEFNGAPSSASSCRCLLSPPPNNTDALRLNSNILVLGTPNSAEPEAAQKVLDRPHLRPHFTSSPTPPPSIASAHKGTTCTPN